MDSLSAVRIRRLGQIKREHIMWKDSETIIDYLNFDYIIDAVVKLVLDDDLSPSSIGLYGDWGSGKSSLMKMVEQYLTSMDDKSTLCIRFNGWLFEGYEDAKTALCGTILESIHKKEGISSQVKGKVKKLWNKVDVQKILGKGIRYGLDYFMTGGVLSLTDFTISQIANALKKNVENVTDEEIANALRSLKTDSNIRKDIKNFHDEFEKILKETNIKHLVVFIDELDRCAPETILDIIEAMRLFLFAKGTSFVIGADQRLIEYAIKTKYKEVVGNNLDIGREYMEKVIQYPVNIPALDENEVEQYISCLLLEKDLNHEEFAGILQIIKELKPLERFDYEYLNQKKAELAEKCKGSLLLSGQISSVLAKQINGNPRQCKRFLNTLFMRLDMAKSRHIELKKNVMAKLMLIEYFASPLYKLVIDPENKGEFAKFENGEDDVALFKDYANNDWVKAWKDITCKISNENVSDYYYFSNSRFTYNQSVGSQLSPIGQLCLDKLMAKTETNRKEAETYLKELSLMERKHIANTLFEQLKTEDKLDNELFKSYILVICYKDMTTEAMLQIKSIPADKYSKAQKINLLKFADILSPEEKDSLKSYLGDNLEQIGNTLEHIIKRN